MIKQQHRENTCFLPLSGTDCRQLKQQSGSPLLTVEDLSISREKGGQHFELHVRTLEVFAGEVVTIIGPSGSGKSTLTDILALILKSDFARRFQLRSLKLQKVAACPNMDLLQIDDDTQAFLRRHVIGYVMQSGGLLPYLSSRDNILLPCRLAGMSDEEARALVDELADSLSLREQMNKKPAFLSGGQRQRVAIARALAHKPEIILADEPTAAADPTTALDICSLFKEVALRRKSSLIMITHDHLLAERIADRQFYLNAEQKDDRRVLSSLSEHPA